MGRITGTFGGHSQRVGSQFLMGDEGEIGAVHTAAERDDARAHLAKNGPKPVFLLMEHSPIVTDVGSPMPTRVSAGKALDKKVTNSKNNL